MMAERIKNAIILYDENERIAGRLTLQETIQLTQELLDLIEG